MLLLKRLYRNKYMEENAKTNKNWKICSSFVLKIIAFLTMTLDHIGVMSYSYYLSGTWIDIFRIIGRLAMPLFCFMIVEGVIHTKSFGKYALRLGILAALISTSFIILVSVPDLGFADIRDYGNIFIDLLMGATAVYCLRLKGFKKLFALLPTAFIITSFIVCKYEYTSGAMIHWFPYFLRAQYNLLSFTLIIFFYLSYVVKDLFFKWHTAQIGVDEDAFKGTDIERTTANIISALFLVTITLLFHFFSDYLMVGALSVQIYALFAGAFILLYNGKRGYNSKWFEYGGYLYYPLHILIIALVFYLITL